MKKENQQADHKNQKGEEQVKESREQGKDAKKRGKTIDNRRWGLILTWVGIVSWLILLFSHISYGSGPFYLLAFTGMVAFVMAVILYFREYSAHRDEDLSEGEGNPAGALFILSQALIILCLVLIFIFLFVLGNE